ncbi:hypothetical protein RFI_26518, partial [Reticulomyxa filosa]
EEKLEIMSQLSLVLYIFLLLFKKLYITLFVSKKKKKILIKKNVTMNKKKKIKRKMKKKKEKRTKRKKKKDGGAMIEEKDIEANAACLMSKSNIKWAKSEPISMETNISQEQSRSTIWSELPNKKWKIIHWISKDFEKIFQYQNLTQQPKSEEIAKPIRMHLLSLNEAQCTTSPVILSTVILCVISCLCTFINVANILSYIHIYKYIFLFEEKNQ